MTDINNFIEDILREKGDADRFLEYLYGELKEKGIGLKVGRCILPIGSSNITKVELDLSDHDKEKDAEIEKYKKSFESAKCERDKAVCEYRNEIDQLKSRVQELEESQEDLPYEPIKVADALIDKYARTRIEYMDSRKENTRDGQKYCDQDIYDSLAKNEISLLRQIAEHILVYCKYCLEEE